MIGYPKEIIIATLRDFFSKDSYYHYSKDVWGFPNTSDHTDLPLGSGIHDNSTTRVFIGENYRYDGIYYPAILVKNSGTKYVPISINRDEGTVQWQFREYKDGYGNSTFFKTPKSLLFRGAWEGSIAIDIITRSLRSRDDLTELVAMCFTDITFKSLQKAGVIIKPISVGSPSESDDRNDKLFRQTITLDVRSEWRREIPISNLVEIIGFTTEFSNILQSSPVAQNITINTYYDVLSGLLDEIFKVEP
jgi:hypothetical protein